ncbi:ABC transporter substrate-binding protein [Thermus scotoductus]|uniref:Branched-chain amino acid ABC transporter substrate-binding protein n=1 Tax=Thermus scotoductus TaxID=37636 RepID=A0A430RB44_THESC|nr:ABC transporter substrate-binding protein [Thermus scotoductus]RTG97583.1 branched-chain amino acid ABC transporter substrate-binding protein [Thermus scotoductus]RTH04621.1 branched-chain amino acid ABC transporter substrate-binding protein [Thermus scotoductus]RTH16962.1 branched-chain amino acid ABC transporter substrate-binding protein [Thermus scotoductus]RTI02739.1 branched-chain amino acid ABC transporter substrate-binding protein [Thermus scotoductus]RTI24819.1 branched-chain amino 
MRKLWFGLLAAAGLALGQQQVTILWSGAITGPTSDAGAPYGAAVEDYCKYANEKKLIPGVVLNCLVRDDQYNNANTQRFFEEALDRFKIPVFLSYATGANLQLKSLIQEVKVPTIPASMHVELIDPPNNDYFFIPTTTYSEQVVALLEYIAKQKKGAKVALVVHPSPFGRAPIADARKAAAQLGLQIVDVQEVGAGNLDNTALLKRFERAGVEYLVHQNVAGPVANILKDAKRLGLDKKFKQLGAHYTGGPDLISLAGDAAEGFLWATSFYMFHEDAPGIRLQKELGQKYGRPQAIVGSVNYTNGMLATAIAVEAMRRAQERFKRITGETVYQALVGMNGPNAFKPGFAVSTKQGIEIDFTKSERTGAEGLRILEAKGGRFVPITEPFTSALFRKVHYGK